MKTFERMEATKQLVKRENPFPASEGWHGAGTEERFQYLIGAVDEQHLTSQVWFLNGREVEALGISKAERLSNLKTKALRIGHGPTPIWKRMYPVERVYDYLLGREVQL